MGVHCSCCKTPASLEKPVFVRYRCYSCSAKWYECEACEGKLVNPQVTKLSGCSLCRPTLAKVQYDALKNQDDDTGTEDMYAIDLRNSVEFLKSDFLERIQGNHFIPALLVTIVGCEGRNFWICCDGPVEMYPGGLWNESKEFDNLTHAGSDLFFCEGYQVRVWSLLSEIEEKSTWSWKPIEGYPSYHNPLKGKKFLWVAGLTLEEMLDTLFTTAKTLHDNGYYDSNHDTTPYPVHVASQAESSSHQGWDENFREHWICACNVANFFPRSVCEGCGANLTQRMRQVEGRSRYIPSDVKKSVFQRDNGVCVKCGSGDDIEFDHIIPFSKGGSSSAQNVQLLCKKHNREKGNKIL